MDKLLRMLGCLLFILKAKNIITNDEYELITQKITPEEFNERLKTMRAIDADELKRRLRIPCKDCAHNGNIFCRMTCEINDIIEEIDKQPTIKVKKDGKI